VGINPIFPRYFVTFDGITTKDTKFLCTLKAFSFISGIKMNYRGKRLEDLNL
jgi:hypothetical protein